MTDKSEIPVMQKANDQNTVGKNREIDKSKNERSWRDILLRSSHKIKIYAGFISEAVILSIVWWRIGWIIPVTVGVLIFPLIVGLKKVIKIPTRLVMEYKRKLKHFNLYSIPNKLFRHFDIDPRTAKLTAGSNQFVFLCSNADLENYEIETSWPSVANPFDFRVDEDAYFELAYRYEKMAEQDLANIAIPQAIGMEKARENSRKLDEHDFDDLPEDYMELKKKRPTESYDRLKKMKKVGKNER